MEWKGLEELLSTGTSGLLLVDCEHHYRSKKQDRPEVVGDLGEDLSDEDELVGHGHVEVFLNHVSIMSGNAGKGTD